MIEAQPGAPTGSVLRNRNFLLLWTAQALSQTAQNAIWYGLMVVVEETTQSATQMSLAVLTSILPSVILGLVAGAFVDRMNKKRVLVITNALRAVATLAYLLYGSALGAVFVVNFICCSISQFFGPAESATIPQLVSKRQLITANSFFNLTFTLSQLAGLVILGPAIIKLIGAPALFIGIAVIYAVCAVLVSFLPKGDEPQKSTAAPPGSTVGRQLWDEVKEGWTFIRNDHSTSVSMINLTAMSCLMLLMATLAPRYVVAVLQIPADNAVFVLAPAGLGVLIGMSQLENLSMRISRRRLMNAGLLVMGVGFVAMGLLDTIAGIIPTSVAAAVGLHDLPVFAGLVPAVMILALLFGTQYAFVTVPSQTTLMERAPVDSRGRVFAVQIMLGNIVSVIPLLFVGGLADIFGIRLMISVVGVITVGIGILTTRMGRVPR